MNDCELNIRMSDEEIERIKELLTKDKGIKHYLLKLNDNEEKDVVEYKEYENLQQRINKAIEILNKYKKLCESKLNFEKNTHSPTARHNETYWKDCIDKLNYILSILHDEKEK